MGKLTPAILVALSDLATAIIDGNPEMKSSDRAFSLCLHEFRLLYQARRAARATAPQAESTPAVNPTAPLTEQFPPAG